MSFQNLSLTLLIVKASLRNACLSRVEDSPNKKERTILSVLKKYNFKAKSPVAISQLLFASARVFLDIGFGIFFYFLVSKTFHECERKSVPVPFVRVLERAYLAESRGIH